MRGHKCQLKQTQLFLVQILGDNEECVVGQAGDMPFDTTLIDPCISMNDLSGGYTFTKRGRCIELNKINHHHKDVLPYASLRVLFTMQ